MMAFFHLLYHFTKTKESEGKERWINKVIANKPETKDETAIDTPNVDIILPVLGSKNKIKIKLPNYKNRIQNNLLCLLICCFF